MIQGDSLTAQKNSVTADPYPKFCKKSKKMTEIVTSTEFQTPPHNGLANCK